MEKPPSRQAARKEEGLEEFSLGGFAAWRLLQTNSETVVTKVATMLATADEKKLEIDEAHRHRVCYVVGMRWVWCALFPVLLGGCLSPTLPLPPPEPPTEMAGTEPNTIILTGTGTPEATMLIINDDPMFAAGQQCGQDSCQVTATQVSSAGVWKVTVFAVKNDDLQIIELIGDEESQPQSFLVN